MNEVEREILRTLVELEDCAKAVRSANAKSNLSVLFTRIDNLAGQLPPSEDRELIHYLHRKSYEKARLWLEARYPTFPAG